MKVFRYEIVDEINIGTEEKPILHKDRHEVIVPWSEAYEEIVRKEAYNGEINVEEIPDEPKTNFIPTPEQSAVVMMRAAFAQQVKDMENDMVLRCSGLAEPWVPGDHKSGEIYNVGD